MIKIPFLLLVKASGSLLLIILAGCNPYQPYSDSHLNILAEFDPVSGQMDVNLQMVYLSKTDHADSIVFNLNRDFSILSLSAQELVRYELSEDGQLVLYIQEAVPSGDRLHISMSYTGNPGCFITPGTNRFDIDSMICWLPFRDDIQPLTYRMGIQLPQGFRVENCNRTKEATNLFIIENPVPGPSVRVSILRELP